MKYHDRDAQLDLLVQVFRELLHDMVPEHRDTQILTFVDVHDAEAARRQPGTRILSKLYRRWPRCSRRKNNRCKLQSRGVTSITGWLDSARPPSSSLLVPSFSSVTVRVVFSPAFVASATAESALVNRS
jgi:Ran GTPase-activating protein (RanGAP) involved in mRNA processing and transport